MIRFNPHFLPSLINMLWEIGTNFTKTKIHFITLFLSVKSIFLSQNEIRF